MEDALGIMRNKETALGAVPASGSASGGLGGGRKRAQQGAGAGAATSSHHLEQDERWVSLNKKEKQFCVEHNMKPTSYCTLRR